jgi:tRNA pseudouridine38-40 synthase
MARYKLTLAYDGTAFSGSQRQARRRTVQEELEKALRALGWLGASAVLAGRTDAGVHASGQVAAADVEWRHSSDALRDALNARLPRDVVVVAVEIVNGRFHPRFDAVCRRYRYVVRCQAVRDPLHERTTWTTWPPPDEAILTRLAKCFVGRHDFGAFGSATRRGGSTVRTVTESQWTGANEEWCFEIAADSFLYRLVRRLVYVQIAAAQRRCPEEVVLGALESGLPAAEVVAGLAPPQGLVLVGVQY